MLGLRLAAGIALADIPDSSERLMRNAATMIPMMLETDGMHLRMKPEGWLVSNAVLVRLLSGI